MQHPRTDTIFLGLWWGREEQIASMHVPLMTGTRVSNNPRIPTSEGNLVSSVQASSIGSMLSALDG